MTTPPAETLRVLHLLPSLGIAGMENGVVNLCNRLGDEDFHSTICVFENAGGLENRLDRRRTELLHIPRGFGNDPRVPLRLSRELRRRRIDILHTHSWGTLLEGIAASRLAGTPILVHGEHGTIELRRRNVFVQRWAWRTIDQVLAVCDSLADQLAAYIGFPREEIAVIPNGVDTDHFRPLSLSRAELRRELGLPASGFLLGMVARLIPLKDHAGVIRAIATLGASGLDAHLALAGDGPERGALQELIANLQLESRIHFLGEVMHVERVLNALDVFVSNSHREGMSNTILEAMACGLPVVATRVGATPELLAGGSVGLLVKPRDNRTLMQACRLLAGHPHERRRLGVAARERVETCFSISTMVQAYSTLYRKMAMRRSPVAVG